MMSGSRSKAVGGAITVTIKVTSVGEGPLTAYASSGLLKMVFYFCNISLTDDGRDTH